MAQSYIGAGRYPLALQTLSQHMALAQKQNDRNEELLSLRLSAQVYRAVGNFSDARNFYEKAIALAGALGDTQEEALLRNDLAQIIYNRKVE
jgi:tetratricopeptide (TPR) repeat protein